MLYNVVLFSVYTFWSFFFFIINPSLHNLGNNMGILPFGEYINSNSVFQNWENNHGAGLGIYLDHDSSQNSTY